TPSTDEAFDVEMSGQVWKADFSLQNFSALVGANVVVEIHRIRGNEVSLVSKTLTDSQGRYQANVPTVDSSDALKVVAYESTSIGQVILPLGAYMARLNLSSKLMKIVVNI